MRYNPICKAMAERLLEKGKEKMEIIVSASLIARQIDRIEDLSMAFVVPLSGTK